MMKANFPSVYLIVQVRGPQPSSKGKLENLLPHVHVVYKLSQM